MKIRQTNFTICTERPILDQLNYVNNVVAVCVLNNLIEVFTVYHSKGWFSKPKYRLTIRLNSCITGNILGCEYFDTPEEAIKYGKEYIDKLFPMVDQ